VLGEAARALAAAGLDDARREAGWLLSDLLRTDPGGLVVRRDERVPPALRRQFADWIERRARREPAQYIAGRVEFHGVEIRIDARALIPRPETEGLVDVVLATQPAAGAIVLDAGTGSGCIAIAVALARPDLAVRAVDRSTAAVALARENVRRHGLESRVQVVCGDFGTAETEWDGRVDIVVANPPYVPSGQWAGLQVEVRDHEPREALVAGPTGLEAYEALARSARHVLRPGGAIVLEVGFDQSERVRALLAERGFERIDVRSDLAGIPRFVVARTASAA
jgi:release factor glutamine methyltransferase